MQKYKITGYAKIGFEKIVECENFEKANLLADLIERSTDVDDSDMNNWIDEVEVDEVEEVEE
jgi:hypothetical protein